MERERERDEERQSKEIGMEEEGEKTKSMLGSRRKEK